MSGCSTQLSEKQPEQYANSLEKAKTLIKSNRGVDKYEKYYNAPSHKAFAQSKINSTGSFATNKTSKEYAIETALEDCNRRLLKKYDAITEKVSCKIINVDNE